MSGRFSKPVIAGIWLLLGGAHASATPWTLGYGGRLTGSQGAPVAGPVDLRFRFFDAATGGNQLGADVAAPGVSLVDGVFQTPLTLDGSVWHQILDQNPSVFIEVTDLTDQQTYPRQAFRAVPYALRTPVDGKTVAFDANGVLVAAAPAALSPASGSQGGVVSAADWNAFNAKTTSFGAASSAQNGYLSAADWSAFNAKQPTLGSATAGRSGFLASTDWVQFNAAPGKPYVDGLNAAQAAAIAALSTNLTTASGNVAAISANVATASANASALTTALKKDGSVALSGAWNVGGQDMTNTGNVLMAGGKALGLGVASSDPGGLGAADAGKIWYSNGMRLWVGASAQTLAYAGTGVLAFDGLNTNAQSLAIGALGNAPAWNSAGTTHTLNIPMANAAGVTGGLVANTEWTLFNGKQPLMAAAAGSANGFVASADWAAFNAKQSALTAANGATLGYLTSSDWAKFNGREPAVIAGSTSQFYRGDKTWQTPSTANVAEVGSLYYTTARAQADVRAAVSAAGPVVYTVGTGAFTMAPANSTTNGYVGSADWVAFNAKQNALSAATSGGPGYVVASDWTAFNAMEPPVSSGTTSQYYRGDKVWQSLNSGAAVESTNLYYTTARIQADARGSVSVAPPLVYNAGTGALSLSQAALSADGFLGSSDWATFNAKQPGGSYVSAPRNIGTMAPLNGGGTLAGDLTLSMAAATVSANGYLASADWKAFNLKEPGVTAGTTSQFYRGDKSWQLLNTVAVPEAGSTNLYFSNARARSAFSATAPVVYDATGGYSLPVASSVAHGFLSASDWATFNGKTGSLGFAPINRAGDAMTASLSLPASGLAVGTNQLFFSGGNIGIGSTAPAAKLDVGGYARLAPNGAAPVACSATYDGSVAMTGTYQLCVCNVSSWVSAVDGISACTWPSSGALAFTYTGATQSFVVPAGITSITVKSWGAGGGGGGYSSNNGGNGAAGGFAQATITTTPGEILTVSVGGGGGGGLTGGAASGGGGGGKSGVDRSGTQLIVAAGGGGGGGPDNSGRGPGAGGAGGGSAGVAGSPDAFGASGGGAGQAAAYGAAGAGSFGPGLAGTSGGAGRGYAASGGPAGGAAGTFLGGAGGYSDGGGRGGGGGGGGGYYSGGGGGCFAGGGGGGGGSSYVSGTSTTMTAGSGTTPGGNGDINYTSGVGVGGAGGTSASGTAGGNGRVYISWGTGGSAPSNVVLTSGTSTTVPSGHTSAKVWAIGGGGGGAGSTSSDATSGGGGGAGGVAYKTYSVSSGQTITYAVGSAGGFGTGAAGGAAGTSTTVTIGGVTITAGGGAGGNYQSATAASGGTYSGGDGGSNGGTGAGAAGDEGGGSGGAIGGVNGTQSSVSGYAGAASADVSGLFATLAAVGSYPTVSGGSAGPAGSGGTANVNNGGDATGFGCGGGSAGFYGGNGGAGLYGGGGGGASGFTGVQTGGAGGSGAVVIEFF